MKAVIKFSIFTSIAIFFILNIGQSYATNFKKDISYGNSWKQKLDIYTPDINTKNKLRPVHIYIHGGAWIIGDKRRSSNLGAYNAQNGIILVSVNYRLSPKHKHPAHIDDCASAVKWVYDNIEKYGGDKDNIHLSGHSAGAHLAALLATNPKYLNAHNLKPSIFKTVMPVDTASFNFTIGQEKRPNFVKKAIKKSFGEEKQTLKDASPFHHVNNSKNSPQFILFVTQKREDAVIQTRDFHNALNKAGASSQIHIIPSLSHAEMNKAMYDEASIIGETMINAILQR